MSGLTHGPWVCIAICWKLTKSSHILCRASCFINNKYKWIFKLVTTGEWGQSIVGLRFHVHTDKTIVSFVNTKRRVLWLYVQNVNLFPGVMFCITFPECEVNKMCVYIFCRLVLAVIWIADHNFVVLLMASLCRRHQQFDIKCSVPLCKLSVA